MRQTAQVFRRAVPDWHAGQEAHIAEGDLVAERFTARGTHQGELLGVAPDRAGGRAGIVPALSS
jgi:predicted ester cyclase